MGLGTVDIVLLVLSLVCSVVIGIYHGIKGLKQTPTDYMLGGRTMKPIPLAMSMTVGTVSAITIMGNAGEMYAHGTQLWVMDLGIALGMYFVAKVFIPIFYPLKMLSLYYYIEYRFKSKWLRRATVLLTVVLSYVFLGFLLYPPSIVLQAITGFSTINNIVITGLACSVYSSFGGVKGVVYTDVLQSIIMLIGVVAIIIQGASNVGGISKAWDIAYHHDRIEFFNFDLDPYQRHSFWLVLVFGFFFSLSTYGVHQSQTQRTFSTSSVAEAQRVIYYAIFGMLVLKGSVNLSGITLFATYAKCDPLTVNPDEPADNIVIVVTYVIQHLTKIPGLSGIFVASIYAAVLSSVSTQVNSTAALVWEDFLKAIPRFSSFTDVTVARIQKILVLLTGILGIFMSIFISNFASFLRTLFQITGAVSGPMIGLFLLAVYLPWIKCKGAAIGFVASIGFSLWIVIGQLLTQDDPTYLRMSRTGCPISTAYDNITQEMSIANDNITQEMFSVNNSTSLLNHGTGFYGISYCLNSCWGAFSCILVALLITAFTGSNTVDDVEEKLVSPTSWYWFSVGFKKGFANYYKSFKYKTRKNREIVKNTTEDQEEMESFNKNDSRF